MFIVTISVLYSAQLFQENTTQRKLTELRNQIHKENEQKEFLQMEKIKNYTKEDLLWLTRNIYFEARSENLHGKMIVGFVTLNRVIHPQWDDTIKGVITQKWQFSWYNKYYGTGKVPTMWNIKARNECKKIAELCLSLYNSMAESKDGWEFDGIANGAVFYFADYIDPPSWSKDLAYIGKVGPHLLFKYPERPEKNKRKI